MRGEIQETVSGKPPLAGATQPLQTQIHYIELLRFILAFLTMIWHYYYYAPVRGHISAQAVEGFGIRYLSFSVEAFFVISGFVILISAANKNSRDFFINRVVRLGPALLVCSTVTLVATGLLSEYLNSVAIRRYVEGILVLPLIRGGGLDGSLWSLTYELRFYLIIATVMLFTDVCKRALPLAASIIFYDSTVLVAEFTQTYFGFRDTILVKILKFPFDNYAPFFAIGVLCYAHYFKQARPRQTAVFLLVATGLASARAYQEATKIGNRLEVESAPMAIGLAIVAVILIAIFLSIRSEKNFGLQRLYAFLGGISYPLYLIHQNAGYLLTEYLIKLVPGIGDPRPLVIALMIVAASLVFLYAEPRLKHTYRTLCVGAFTFVRKRAAMVRAQTPAVETKI